MTQSSEFEVELTPDGFASSEMILRVWKRAVEAGNYQCLALEFHRDASEWGWDWIASHSCGIHLRFGSATICSHCDFTQAIEAAFNKMMEDLMFRKLEDSP